jgi:hypothetical protein
MDQISAMRMFVRVVERGSFSAVACLGQPAVSKQITALEAHLGGAPAATHLPQPECDGSRPGLLRVRGATDQRS